MEEARDIYRKVRLCVNADNKPAIKLDERDGLVKKGG